MYIHTHTHTNTQICSHLLLNLFLSVTYPLSLSLPTPPPTPHTHTHWEIEFLISVPLLLTYVPLAHPVSHHRTRWQQWPGRKPESFEFTFVNHLSSLSLSQSPTHLLPNHPTHTERISFSQSLSSRLSPSSTLCLTTETSDSNDLEEGQSHLNIFLSVTCPLSLYLPTPPPLPPPPPVLSPTSTPHTDRISLSQSSSPRLSPSPTPRLTIEPGDSNDLKEGQHHERQSGSIVVNKSEEPQTSLPHTHTHILCVTQTL